MNEDIKTLKGARILFKRTGSSEVEEGYVKALSSNNTYVNLQPGRWLPVGDVNVVDVIQPAPAPTEAAPQVQQQQQQQPQSGTETGTNGAAN